MTPARPRGMFGREPDLARLRALVDRGSGLVTVLGPGGMGKTSLVQLLAAQGRAEGRRVVWVDLEAAQTVDELTSATRRAMTSQLLGQPSPVSADEPAEVALERVWSQAGELWLVLDNFEQLLPHAAPLIAQWHARNPELSLVLTSRETLHVSEESVFELGPLALEGPAVELLIDRIARGRTGWRPTTAEHTQLKRVATLLDGIPLALELAAARARVLPVEVLAEQLELDLSLLDEGPRDHPPRHRALHVVIAASFARLDEPEREVLWAASLFRGTFAPAELADLVGDTAQGLGRAQSLRERSLLAEAAPGRLVLYAPILDFVRRHPPSAEIAARIEKRHTTRALDDAEAGRGRPEELMRVVLRAERPEHATDRAVHEEALRAARALRPRELGLAEGSPLERALELVIARSTALGLEPAQIAGASLTHAELAWSRGRHAVAIAELEPALEQGLTGRELLRGRLLLARAYFGANRLEAALPTLEQAISEARALGDVFGEAQAMQVFGAVRQSLGRRTEAQVDLEAAVRLTRQVGHRELEAHAEGSIGVLMLDEGRVDAARERLHHAALLAAETGQTRTREVLCGYAALAFFESGDLDAAERWLGEALEGARRTRNGLHAAIYGALAGAVSATRDQVELAAEGFAEAEAALMDVSPWAEVVRVHRGHLHLARARRAHAHGQHVEREQELTLAEGCRRVADSPTRSTSDDLRIAARILERALLREIGAEALPPAPTATRALLLGEQLRWFSVDGGGRIDLSRRPLLRTLLGALADQHEAGPGVLVERMSLIARAWPGEIHRAQIHLNRLHVALSTLRSLGLRDLLERTEQGYRLAAQVEVHRMTPAPDLG